MYDEDDVEMCVMWVMRNSSLCCWYDSGTRADWYDLFLRPTTYDLRPLSCTIRLAVVPGTSTQCTLDARGRTAGRLTFLTYRMLRKLSAAYKYCLLYGLRLTAYCLLLTAYCLLLTAYCLLPTAYGLLYGDWSNPTTSNSEIPILSGVTRY